ncbi:Glucosyltransferase-like protein [Coemansia biformis]|uniref:Alpha-1,3-glucosyltransferase n=1 Tax=Coemansia biformis TaxID=1286918 RepID=A0A9W7YGC2_9FUNG|nr:Glucosyltransferase-like protein [Coemansia biformis]
MARRGRPAGSTQPIETVPVRRWFRFLEAQGAQGIALPVTLLFSLLVRWCVSLHGYSGRGKPPLFGDYEAQRHWMELTIHLPPKEWYYFDLQYWGLDYPPLTAFQSWLCGLVAHWIDPSWVALGASRGIETHASKLFMRATVVVLEFAVFVPAVVLLFQSRQLRMPWAARQMATFCMLLQPGLVLIDHGHFQYNAVMLGFVVWAVYFALREKHVLMAVAFCCSFMFKQMALYFAPAVFFFLLAKCLQPPRSALLFVKLALAVLGTIGTMLLPWIHSPSQLQQILVRVFPVARGLYEDKVANVWCAVNVVVRLRSLLPVWSLVRLATAATVVAFLPACLHMFHAIRRQSRSQAGAADASRLFRYCLLNTSLAFFLFSFQAHEKSILIPLAPALMLIHEEERAVSWLVQVALFSNYPLLFRDGLHMPYWVLAAGWSFLRSRPGCSADKQTSSFVACLQWLTTLAMLAIHACHAVVPPPPSLPDIYAVLNATFSCVMFAAFFLYFNYRQFAGQRLGVTSAKQKTA